MELSPQALHDVEFREARRGGYNTRDVDDFLERVAVGVGQVQDRLREAYHRAEAAEGRLAEMQRQLDELQRRGPVESGPGDADETLRRTLVLAQRTADATIKEAKDEANRLLTEARDEVAQARAAAESDAHRDARAELEHLSSRRDALLSDLETLEQHVDAQRNRIRESVGDLQQLLDEPDTLHVDPAPAESEVTPPARPESLPSRGDGLPPRGEGLASRGDGFPSRGEGLPSRGDGLPSRGEGLPSRGDGLPSRGEGLPSRGDSIPSRGESLPTGNGTLPAPSTPPPLPGQVTVPAPPTPSPSPNGGYANSPFAGVDFGRSLGNGAPPEDGPSASVFDPPKSEAPGFDPPSFDPPSFDPPSFDPPPFDSPKSEAPRFDPPGFDPPSFESPKSETPGFDPPSFDSPAFESPKFDTPAFIVPPPPPSPPAPAQADGSMVGALQELHGTPPPVDPLPAREGLPSRGDALPSLDLPGRGDALSARDGMPPVDMPPREPLPSRGDPLAARDPLPSREAGRDPLPSRDAAREPLPPRNPHPLPPAAEPVAVPGPGQPGSTGFLPDLNAVFNPPGGAPEPAPVDDLALPIDAPPPPPTGFEHLQDMNGIPIEPGSRPSEWGRGVFDADEELSSGENNARFGRRS